MLAGWFLGVSIGLMTFGGQMLAAPALVRFYLQHFMNRPDLTVYDVRPALWATHLVVGGVIAALAKWAYDRGYVF